MDGLENDFFLRDYCYSLEGLFDLADFLGAPSLVTLCTRSLRRECTPSLDQAPSETAMDVLAWAAALRPNGILTQSLASAWEEVLPAWNVVVF